MAQESFSCKHYFILLPTFLQGALIFIQGVWCNDEREKNRWLLQICLKNEDHNGSLTPENVFLSIHLKKLIKNLIN